MQRLPALKNPYEAHRPRVNRETLTFNEALGSLLIATDGVARCIAFPSYGRCKKYIHFDRSYYFRIVNELSTKNIESVISLMHLMLCPTHWGQAVYNHTIFLDGILNASTTLDTEAYENMVVDIESAKELIKEEESSPDSSLKLSLRARANSITKDPARDNHTTGSLDDCDFFQNNKNDVQDLTERTCSKLLSTYTSTTPSTRDFSQAADQGEKTSLHDQIDPIDDLASEDEQTKDSAPRRSDSINLCSYASLELGVAKLEIMYQGSLKCIAMASDGWRCQESIPTEQIHEARRLLPFLDDSQTKLKDLATLVLCPRHHYHDQLPQLYAEAWSEFSSRRLPKDVAMSRFDPEQWESVKFFKNQDSPQMEVRKTKSTSNMRENAFGRVILTPRGHKKTNSNLATLGPKLPQGLGTKLSLSEFSFSLERLGSRPPESSHVRASSESQLPSSGFITKTPHILVSTPDASQISSSTTDYTAESGFPDNAASNCDLPVETISVDGRPIVDRTSLEETKVEAPSTLAPAHLSTNSPPSDPSILSEDVTNLSYEFGRVSISSENSINQYINLASVSATIGKVVPDGDTRGNQTAQPRQGSVPLRDTIRIIHQGIVDGTIAKEMRSTIQRGGYVYIFKSADRNLVKIGKSGDVERRKAEIRTGCQLQDLEEVDSGSYHIRDPERVERLAHLELRNFRVTVTCQHLHGGNGVEVEQEHKEWFDVPEHVAIRSAQLWRQFVDNAYTSEGTIKEYWSKRITEIPGPSDLERTCLKNGLEQRNEHFLERHHEMRYRRYREWMDASVLYL